MKIIHLLLGILLLLIFLCLYLNIESFGNPFDKPFMQQINNTDFKNESICRDDMTWKNKEKTCKDYSITGSDCSDIGDNGVVAFDACRVACDNCPRSVEIKIRQPSPSADYAEPPYSTFEGSLGEFEGEDIIGSGSADFREIFMKLGEIEEKIETTSIENNSNSNREYCISVTTRESTGGQQQQPTRIFNDNLNCTLVPLQYDENNEEITNTGCCTNNNDETAGESIECHYVPLTGLIETENGDCGNIGGG